MLRPGESRGSPMRLNVVQLADKMLASRGQRTRPSPFRVPRAFLSISLLVVRVGWYVGGCRWAAARFQRGRPTHRAPRWVTALPMRFAGVLFYEFSGVHASSVCMIFFWPRQQCTRTG
jgi:hypothetical protein